MIRYFVKELNTTLCYISENVTHYSTNGTLFPNTVVNCCTSRWDNYDPIACEVMKTFSHYSINPPWSQASTSEKYRRNGMLNKKMRFCGHFVSSCLQQIL